MTNEERISLFVDEIQKEALSKKKKLEKESDSKITAIFNSGKVEIDKEVDNYIRTESEKIRSENSKRIAGINSDSKKELLKQRTVITKEIFAEIRAKLEEYVASNEYLDSLKTSISKAISDNFDLSEILLMPRDLEKLNGLDSVKSVKLTACDTIEIGGFKAFIDKNGKLIDNTLDSKLAAQHEWFAQNSGLIIS